MMDLDLKASVPRIRYLISTDGETYYVLHDEAGTSWFEGAAGTSTVRGLVEFLGPGSVHAVRCVDADGGFLMFFR